MNRTFTADLVAGSNLTLTQTQIQSAAAKLLTQNLPLSFSQAFASDSGFTYDSVKAEFTGGVVRQKLTRPAGAIFGAAFSTNEEGTWGDDSLDGSLQLGAVISGGKLDLTGGSQSHWKCPASTSLFTTVGAMRIRYTPTYSGSPSTDQYIFSIGNGTNFTSSTYMRHANTGVVWLQVRDQLNNTICNADFGNIPWAPVSGTEYEIEINFDLVTGATRLFINGTQHGFTDTTTGTRTLSGGTFYKIIGLNPYFSGPTNVLFKARDFVVFNTVQHTANYTAGTYVVDNNYWSSNVDLPAFADTGAISLAGTAFSGTATSNTRFIVDGKYWNGSAWVASNNTYAQSSSIADINTNIASLILTTSFVVSVVFNTETVIQNCDLLTLNYTAVKYYANGTVQTSSVGADGISAFSATSNAPAGTTIGFVIMLGSTPKYWNGSAWATSDGTYAQSNPAATINTNAASLTVPPGTSLSVKAIMDSSDLDTTPTLSAMSLTYAFRAAAPTLSTCLVYGYLLDAQGSGISGQKITFDVIRGDANPYREASGAVITETQVSVTTESDGYFEVSLIRTSQFEAGGRYRVNFGQNSTRAPLDISVPDAEVSDITSLLTSV